MHFNQKNSVSRVSTVIAKLTSGIVLAVCASSAFADTNADEAVAATQDFFAKMSARDFVGVSHYIPDVGFTEIVPETDKLLELNAKAFEGLFKSGRKIALRAVDLQARVLGDNAIVTGTRVGYVAAADSTAVPSDGRLTFTMVWSKHAQVWQLHHIHLSAQADK